MKRCSGSRLIASTLAAAVGVCISAATAQSLGLPPDLNTASVDLQRTFALPSLRIRSEGPLKARTEALQVMRRARVLQLTADSALQSWEGSRWTLAQAQLRLSARFPPLPRLFSGTRVSQLNAVLRDPAVKAVRVTSAQLRVDEPLLVRRSDLWLDLGKAELENTDRVPSFLVRIEDAVDVTLEGGAIAAGERGVLVRGGRGVTLRGGRYENLHHGGVVISDSSDFVVGHARFSRIGGAPLMIHGSSTEGAAIGNDIAGNVGDSNWHAGIVLSDRSRPVADDPLSMLSADRHGVIEERIDHRLRGPRRNVLAFNRIVLNASSGIYSDGAIQTVIFDNLVEGNSKEGICLDNGSTANVVAMNVVRQNGKRWGKTDQALRLDFVDRLGRMADGSSVAKTPGISLDNAVYNVLHGNLIDRNHGGGVKMVRTALFNTVSLNLLSFNNEGRNERFHFFGIELGAAPQDVAVKDLDFTPSRGNVVFGNTIRGNHYAGIFYGPGSTDNDALDNSIFGATAWAMEQVQPQANRSINNLSNRVSRHIDPGLNPTQAKAATPAFGER